MLNSAYTRTTITIPVEMLWEIKKRALIEKRAFKEVVIDGLTLYLFNRKKYTELDNPDDLTESLFGSWGKGEKGIDFVKRTRYGKSEKARENYLKKLWKKS